MAKRSWIAILIFTAVIINYIDRIALSIASKPIVEEFGFTPVQMGYLFSGFLWTYVICLIPIGLLVERIGAKRMVGGGIAIWSGATILTAATSGFTSLLGARLVMGASEASTFRPAAASSKLVSRARAWSGNDAFQRRFFGWSRARGARHRSTGGGRRLAHDIRRARHHRLCLAGRLVVLVRRARTRHVALGR